LTLEGLLCLRITPERHLGQDGARGLAGVDRRQLRGCAEGRAPGTVGSPVLDDPRPVAAGAQAQAETG
jgi:hypothetical protein